MRRALAKALPQGPLDLLRQILLFCGAYWAYRLVRGETRENYTYSAGNFTRNRIAGGTQGTGGLFALRDWAPAPDWRATLGARVDFWSDENGNGTRDSHDGAMVGLDVVLTEAGPDGQVGTSDDVEAGEATTDASGR